MWLGVEYHVDHSIFSPGSPRSVEISSQPDLHPRRTRSDLQHHLACVRTAVSVGLYRVQVHIHSYICFLPACIWLHPEAFAFEKKWTYINIMNKGWQLRNGSSSIAIRMTSFTFYKASSRVCPIFTWNTHTLIPTPNWKTYGKNAVNIQSNSSSSPSSRVAQVSKQAIHVNQKLRFESPGGLETGQRSRVAKL